MIPIQQISLALYLWGKKNKSLDLTITPQLLMHQKTSQKISVWQLTPKVFRYQGITARIMEVMAISLNIF